MVFLAIMIKSMFGGDFMNSTNTGILNLLSHGEFSLKDLALYLDVDSKTLVKNISQLNINLKDLNMNEIELKDGKYQLELKDEQWNYVVNSKEFLCVEDIIDYLYLKFIFKGFINLEFEKNQFDISRSSINRYFQIVKNILKENKSTYRYEAGKGLKLEKLGLGDKSIFCKKLIKIFVKNDLSISSVSIYYNLFKDSQLDNLLEKLYNLFSFSEVPATKFILAFSIVLKICIDTFEGFSFDQCHNNLEIYKDIKHKVNHELDGYSHEYKTQILAFLLNLKNNETFFEKESIERSTVLLNELKSRLNITSIEKGFEELLMKKLYMSFFKYENNILNVYSSKLNNEDKKLLKIIKEVLLKTGLNLYFYDKVVLLGAIKKILIENNIKHIQNILLLFNEIVLPHDLYLKDKLKKHLSHINVDILPSFHFKFNYLDCVKHYDLIISDEKHTDSNVKKISTFNYLKILEKIEMKAMENALGPLT